MIYHKDTIIRIQCVTKSVNIICDITCEMNLLELYYDTTDKIVQFHTRRIGIYPI